MLLSRTVELVFIDTNNFSKYVDAIVQAFTETLSAPPSNQSISLADAYSQLRSDAMHDGFGGVLYMGGLGGADVFGFSWWFSMTGAEFYDYLSPRFAPKDAIPQLEGSGVFLNEFGVIPSKRNRGLGRRLLDATLKNVPANIDWIAVTSSVNDHPALALLKSQAFSELDLTGTHDAGRLCLVRETVR